VQAGSFLPSGRRDSFGHAPWFFLTLSPSCRPCCDHAF
jgi:hypothetical protein